jgi:hypothetical protein
MPTFETTLEGLLRPSGILLWLIAVFGPLALVRIASPGLLARISVIRTLAGIALTSVAGGMAFTAASRMDPVAFILGSVGAAAFGSLLIFPCALALDRLGRASACWLIPSVAIGLLALAGVQDWMRRDQVDPFIRAVRSIPEVFMIACVLGGAFALGARLPFWSRGNG